jgi:hypothetical protein
MSRKTVFGSTTHSGDVQNQKQKILTAQNKLKKDEVLLVCKECKSVTVWQNEDSFWDMFVSKKFLTPEPCVLLSEGCPYCVFFERISAPHVLKFSELDRDK